MTIHNQNHLVNYINKISLSKAQTNGRISIIPMAFSSGGFPFITMKDAMKNNDIKIIEISESGSVPELRVINSGSIPILLLDGEEVLGAKQNRIFNTSILIPDNSELVVPVTCTEQGRWGYVSKSFQDSNEVLSYNIRASKMGKVSDSLKYKNDYRSDQGEVWDSISRMSGQKNVFSRTGAMKDVYESEKDNLESILNYFPLLKNQNGIMVWLDDIAIGFDLIGSHEAYAQYHQKLLRSYLIGFPDNKMNKKNSISIKNGKSFLKKISSCYEDKFKSPGYGWDCRYEGNGLVGSSLHVDGNIIHTSFFSNDKQNSLYRNGRRDGLHY